MRLLGLNSAPREIRLGLQDCASILIFGGRRRRNDVRRFPGTGSFHRSRAIPASPSVEIRTRDRLLRDRSWPEPRAAEWCIFVPSGKIDTAEFPLVANFAQRKSASCAFSIEIDIENRLLLRHQLLPHDIESAGET